MKTIMDKLKTRITLNKKMIVFLTVLGLIGIIAGSLFVAILNSGDKALVSSYLNEFVSHICGNEVDYVSGFLNGILSSLLFIIAIWLLGFSVVGIPITVFMYFIKTFILGFSITSIIYHFHVKGILISLLYVFPHHVINIILYILLMIYSLTVSIKLGESIVKKKSIDFKPIMNKYLMILAIGASGMILSTAYETFALPHILKMILGILK